MLINAFDISFTGETLYSEKLFNFPVRLVPGDALKGPGWKKLFGKGITTNIRRVFSNAQVEENHKLFHHQEPKILSKTKPGRERGLKTRTDLRAPRGLNIWWHSQILLLVNSVRRRFFQSLNSSKQSQRRISTSYGDVSEPRRSAR